MPDSGAGQRIRAPFLTAFLASGLLLSGACAPQLPQTAPRCLPPPPDIAAASLQAGSLEALRQGRAGLRVGVALRDESVTIIGFCLSAFGSLDSTPTARAGGRTLRPFGGSLSESAAGRFNYLFYPPTNAPDVEVLQGAERLAVVRFDGMPSPTCRLSASGNFRVTACGAIGLVAWESPLRFDPGRVELLDAQVWDRRAMEPLSFYFQGVGEGSAGLLVRFGFRLPETGKVLIRVNRVYLRTSSGTTSIEVRLDPNVTASFDLSSI